MDCIRLALLLAMTVSARSDQLQAYREHEALVKLYPCGTPQPRVFGLEEIIGEDVLREKTNGYTAKIKPSVTVLHRCYSSGCCEDRSKKCTPLETPEDDVTLTFMISSTTISYLEVVAVNHTRCACL